MVICLERGAVCLHMVQLMPLPSQTSSFLASFKSRLVLPFWYRLTQVVLEKRPLNGCSVVVVFAQIELSAFKNLSFILFYTPWPVKRRQLAFVYNLVESHGF